MNIVELGLRALGVTDADVQNGFKDAEVQLQDGSKRTVRLSAVAPSLREPLLRRYATTGDTRTVVRPMLSGEFTTDDFLDSLAPWSLAQLSTAAVGLCFGVEQLRSLVNHGARMFLEETAQSERRACANQLQMLDQATQQWAFEKGKRASDAPTMLDLAEFLFGGIPHCPSGGSYSLSRVDGHPHCSVHTESQTGN